MPQLGYTHVFRLKEFDDVLNQEVVHINSLKRLAFNGKYFSFTGVTRDNLTLIL